MYVSISLKKKKKIDVLNKLPLVPIVSALSSPSADYLRDRI